MAKETPNDEYVGKGTSTVMDTTFDKGVWTTRIMVVHRRTKDLDQPWEEKASSVEATGETLQISYNRALSAIAEFLEKVGYDMFEAEKLPAGAAPEKTM